VEILLESLELFSNDTGLSNIFDTQLYAIYQAHKDGIPNEEGWNGLDAKWELGVSPKYLRTRTSDFMKANYSERIYCIRGQNQRDFRQRMHEITATSKVIQKGYIDFTNIFSHMHDVRFIVQELPGKDTATYIQVNTEPLTPSIRNCFTPPETLEDFFKGIEWPRRIYDLRLQLDIYLEGKIETRQVADH
jgi:hypothetical protein